MHDIYDLIVIGGGSGGLTAGAFAGELGRKVALIEREKLGGDCTWTGCIPSKTLLKVAKVAQTARTAGKYGISVSEPVVDMAAVREHVQKAIHHVYALETPEEVEKRGVEVVTGEARFLDAERVQVGERIMRAKKFVIATGGSPAIPPIDGIENVTYFTNRNLFENSRLPDHLLVIGAGPIGMEMAQAYRRLGAQVTVIGEKVMPRDEPEASALMKQIFAAEGVRMIETSVTAAAQSGETITLTLKDGQQVQGDMLLVAAGRVPNVAALDLDKAGVSYGAQGITVNRQLQTNIPHIYAIGDVTTAPKFTHYAGFQGSIVGRNVLLPIFKGDGHETVLPWVTFTDPEVAHVGMTEAEARKTYGDAVKTFMFSLEEGDRSAAEDDTQGFIKLVYKGRLELIGATIVAARAGEMLLEYQLIIKKKVSLRAMVSLMHAYPTYSDVAKKALAKLLLQNLLGGTTGRLLKTAAKKLP